MSALWSCRRWREIIHAWASAVAFVDAYSVSKGTVAPRRHLSRLEDLEAEEWAELFGLERKVCREPSNSTAKNSRRYSGDAGTEGCSADQPQSPEPSCVGEALPSSRQADRPPSRRAEDWVRGYAIVRNCRLECSSRRRRGRGPMILAMAEAVGRGS